LTGDGMTTCDVLCCYIIVRCWCVSWMTRWCSLNGLLSTQPAYQTVPLSG